MPSRLGIPLVVPILPRDVKAGRFPRPQDFRHAPGLGDASPRREGRITVKDLADAVHPVVSHLVDEGPQERLGAFSIRVDPQVTADLAPELNY
jgi:hypothetical protein